MSILNLIRDELLNSPNVIPAGENLKYRLHANELPWSSISMDCLDLNFYPDSRLHMQLQDQLATRYQVEPDQIVLTRGSDDGIDLVTRLFLQAGQDAFMQCFPTFPMYAFYVRLQQGQMIQCPLDMMNNFNLSMDAINKYWQPNCKIIMLCSPNNPTGNLIDLHLIASICERYKNQSLVVVDEAYIEFAKAQSAASLLPYYDNLIVLRTLSKAYGLANLRLGAILAQTQVIQALGNIIPPYPVSSVVIELALRALKNDTWFAKAIANIQQEREIFREALQLCATIEKVYPSETNFILVKTATANELTTEFAQQGIAVRNFQPGSLLAEHLRITVGNKEQNQRVLSALSGRVK